MAKSYLIALCFYSILSYAYADSWMVEGKVYCDSCRVEFETKLTQSLPGATVRLECRERDNGTVTYTVEGISDSKGSYHMEVPGEHEDEICEVKTVKSSREDCGEPFKGNVRARILLTKNVGVLGRRRFANPLGFMTKKPHTECNKVLEDMGFLPSEVEL
ncbi:hypothetical protein K2173_001479 [Erythroxylum novogranatense]|uniref:Olee1-like protein n=1 Tax=Erythroxylum novogranatense TaxID=1862640 RepID=A0AAV8UBG3_9ROSI|nr:hypothetical protein K2173_001479 [Erythroxylum novogranatense]